MTHETALRIVGKLDITGAAHGAVHGDFDRVKEALDRHPEAIAALNALDPSKIEETPQGSAAHRGCRETLELFVQRGVRLDVFMAAALGMSDRLDEMLTAQPRLSNALGAHGIHVLNHAKDRLTARALLESGANPNYLVYEPWGWTPVHEAAANGRVDLLEAFAEYGGEIAPEIGTTPLHAAARNGEREAVEWLLDQGASLQAQGVGSCWQDKTPYCVAADNGHHAVARALWKRQRRFGQVHVAAAIFRTQVAAGV